MMKIVLALALLAQGTAFLPAPLKHTRTLATNLQAKKDDVWGTPTRLSEIDDVEEKTYEEKAMWKKYNEDQAGIKQEGVNPTNYEGFVDTEGFDGGDGQVGVVGDGSNHLESFDETGAVVKKMGTGAQTARIKGEAIGGSESKARQKNAFGMMTGYADKLKEEGMVELNEYGEDMLAARRQQLENWANQRALKAEQNQGLQELADLTGVEYDPRFGSKTYFDVLSKDKNAMSDDNKFTITKGEARKEAATELAVLEKGDITATIEMTSAFPKPSFFELKHENDVMGYEDFVVGFSDDSDNGGADFQISPISGTLNGRRGDPTPIMITFKPDSPGGVRNAYMIIETEESKWTYHLLGNVA